MELGNPSFWVNAISFFVINAALVALVVLAVAGFVSSRKPSSRLATFTRKAKAAESEASTPAPVVPAR